MISYLPSTSTIFCTAFLYASIASNLSTYAHSFGCSFSVKKDLDFEAAGDGGLVWVWMLLQVPAPFPPLPKKKRRKGCKREEARVMGSERCFTYRVGNSSLYPPPSTQRRRESRPRWATWRVGSRGNPIGRAGLGSGIWFRGRR